MGQITAATEIVYVAYTNQKDRHNCKKTVVCRSSSTWQNFAVILTKSRKEGFKENLCQKYGKRYLYHWTNFFFTCRLVFTIST